MWLVKMTAIILTLGSFLFREPTFDAELVHQFTSDDDGEPNNITVLSFFTGPSGDTLSSNLMPNLRSGNVKLSSNDFQNFVLLFSLIYAPFAGAPNRLGPRGKTAALVVAERGGGGAASTVRRGTGSHGCRWAVVWWWCGTRVGRKARCVQGMGQRDVFGAVPGHWLCRFGAVCNDILPCARARVCVCGGQACYAASTLPAS